MRAISANGGDWQAGAIQAHGHVQLYGWGGLMVLGIGLHFLPRLMSVSVVRSRLAWFVLGFLSAGLMLRAIAEPILSATPSGHPRTCATMGLVLSATLELIGVAIAVWLIGSFFRQWRSGSRSAPSPGVAALIAIAFTSLIAAMLVNLIGAVETSTKSTSIIPFWADDSSVMLGLVGFLTSISLAMSARLFPLYVQTWLPRERWLRLAALMMLAALVAKTVGISAGKPSIDGAGEILLSGALALAIVALNTFRPRRQLPRRRVRIFTSPLQLHIVTAYLWLATTAVFALSRGISMIGFDVWNVPSDAERHALGAGFVTLLILGVGSEMLPGLARERSRRPGLHWATLILANAAAISRVVPLLFPTLNGQLAPAIMSGAGLLGALAIGIFVANSPIRFRVKDLDEGSLIF